MPSYERITIGLNMVLAGVLGMLIARNRAQLDRDLDASLEREREANAERERATAALRRLEGIIPICAYCHQVRTEAGAWEQLDQYVRSRTDADFSHGMCPACAQRHFPDIVEPGAEQTAPSTERT
jgi:ABC-type nickel/cobalt efflux system permease component RcnA